MEELRIRFNATDKEVERMEYLKDLFQVKTNPDLIRKLLKIKI